MTGSTFKECPKCKKIIKAKAIYCRFCHHDLLESLDKFNIETKKEDAINIKSIGEVDVKNIDTKINEHANELQLEEAKINQDDSRTKICPICSSEIKRNAIFCRYCKNDINLKDYNKKKEINGLVHEKQKINEVEGVVAEGANGEITTVSVKNEESIGKHTSDNTIEEVNNNKTKNILESNEISEGVKKEEKNELLQKSNDIKEKYEINSALNLSVNESILLKKEEVFVKNTSDDTKDKVNDNRIKSTLKSEEIPQDEKNEVKKESLLKSNNIMVNCDVNREPNLLSNYSITKEINQIENILPVKDKTKNTGNQKVESKNQVETKECEIDLQSRKIKSDRSIIDIKSTEDVDLKLDKTLSLDGGKPDKDESNGNKNKKIKENADCNISDIYKRNDISFANNLNDCVNTDLLNKEEANIDADQPSENLEAKFQEGVAKEDDAVANADENNLEKELSKDEPMVSKTGAVKKVLYITIILVVLFAIILFIFNYLSEKKEEKQPLTTATESSVPQNNLENKLKELQIEGQRTNDKYIAVWKQLSQKDQSNLSGWVSGQVKKIDTDCRTKADNNSSKDLKWRIDYLECSMDGEKKLIEVLLKYIKK